MSEYRMPVDTQMALIRRDMEDIDRELRTIEAAAELMSHRVIEH
jgi:hypothetical protein